MQWRGFDLEGLPELEVRDRIERFVDGRATEEDLEALKVWAAADPSNADLLRRIVRAERIAGAAPELWDTDDAWLRLGSRLDGAKPAGVVALRSRRRFRVPALQAAAAAVAVLGGVALWQYRAEVFGPAPVEVTEVATGAGERMALRLPDGSEVVLGASSRMWVPDRFDAERGVRLEGEAVFDVVSDEDHAFVVTTAVARTRVLGTRFGVSAFAADTHAEVIVVEGSVAVTADADSSAGRATEVSAGHAVRVSADGSVAAPRAVDAAALLSWTTGGLAFDGAMVAEVTRTLERRYGFRVVVADAGIGGMRITADFGVSADPAEIVRLIALSLGIEARQSPDGFVLVHPVATTVPASDPER